MNNLESLDLEGLHSLRVLKVQECEKLKEIVCTYNCALSSGTVLLVTSVMKTEHRP